MFSVKRRNQKPRARGHACVVRKCLCVRVCACVLSYGATMTRTTLTKIFILVILAFIICLPEFFSLHRVSKVTFLCLPYQHCERGIQEKKGEHGKMQDADKNKSGGMCDPSQSAEVDKWEQACTQEKPSSMADPGPDSGRGSGDSENSWFLCRTDLDMAELRSNTSSSAVQLRVWVELQLGEAESLNLTLYGHNNHSSLDLHPPEEQGEEADEGKGDKGQGAFYCCLPGVLPPAAPSTNQTRCLLWLANQTVSTATAEGRLPWKRTGKAQWPCLFRVLCLALLCVLLLTVVTSVLGELYRRKRSRKKPTVPPVYHFTGQQLDDGDHTENITPAALHFYGSRRWSELSPIKEAQSQEDIETLLDGNVNNCYTANLHHRVHPSVSSTTEGQQQERSIETDFK